MITIKFLRKITAVKLDGINYNENLTEQFGKLIDVIKLSLISDNSRKDQFRLMQIRKAQKFIAGYPCKIDKNQLVLISKRKGIGDGIIRRIKEILTTGHLDEVVNNKNDMAILELASLHGVGFNRAREYYQRGITNTAILLSKIEKGMKVPTATRLALRYPTTRINREDITAIGGYLSSMIGCQFEICGSYRRGNNTSGDIDVLINNGNIRLQSIIDDFTQRGFLVAHLTTSNKTKYEGICQLANGRYARIDFLTTDSENWSAALLHFTGSSLFNRIVRSIADKNGMKLNQDGLYDRKTGVKLSTIIDTEKSLLNKVGVEWLEPTERNC